MTSDEEKEKYYTTTVLLLLLVPACLDVGWVWVDVNEYWNLECHLIGNSKLNEQMVRPIDLFVSVR